METPRIETISYLAHGPKERLKWFWLFSRHGILGFKPGKRARLHFRNRGISRLVSAHAICLISFEKAQPHFRSYLWHWKWTQTSEILRNGSGFPFFRIRNKVLDLPPPISRSCNRRKKVRSAMQTPNAGSNGFATIFQCKHSILQSTLYSISLTARSHSKNDSSSLQFSSRQNDFGCKIAISPVFFYREETAKLQATPLPTSLIPIVILPSVLIPELPSVKECVIEASEKKGNGNDLWKGCNGARSQKQLVGSMAILAVAYSSSAISQRDRSLPCKPRFHGLIGSEKKCVMEKFPLLPFRSSLPRRN